MTRTTPEQRAELADAAAERDALAAKVERVRALHQPERWYSDYCDDPDECGRERIELWVGELYHADVYDLVCETCSGGSLETDYPAPWPCPTIRALDGEADR